MLVLVVGPSGAGKDSLIAGARRALAGDGRFVFPRRAVTRPAMEDVEDHESVTLAEFARQKASGAYALSWDAHGLSYGIPKSIERDLAEGRVVVANGSRAMVPAAREIYPDMRTVLVDADAAVRAQRLAARGRETAAGIAERLQREVGLPPAGAIRIDNSGALETGIGRLVAILRDLAGG